MALKRIHNELLPLIDDPEISSYFLYESDDNVNDCPSYTYRIIGYLLPQTEPYSYGKFKVEILMPKDYPFKPPQVRLFGCIFHPNLADTSGFFSRIQCHDCCTLERNWSPAMTIAKYIKRHIEIIDYPMAYGDGCFRNRSAADLYKQDREQYNRKVLEFIEKYAHLRSNHSTISLKFITKLIIRKQLDFNSEKINQLPINSNLKNYLNMPLDEKL